MRCWQRPQRAAPSSYSLWEFGTIPRAAFKEVLLGNPAVQAELKITEAQNKAKDEKVRRIREKIQKARSEITDRAKFVEARDSIYKEIEAAILENLTPQQCQRLEQIQLQSQGPLAFYRASIPALAAEGPDPIERLKLTDDQIKQITAIATEGNAEISKAAELPIVLDPKDGAPTPESIKKLVGTEQFNAAKKKTREAARKAWDSVIAHRRASPERNPAHGLPRDARPTVRLAQDSVLGRRDVGGRRQRGKCSERGRRRWRPAVRPNL